MPGSRQRVLLAGAVGLAVVAGAAIGWQVRTAQAAERRQLVLQDADAGVPRGASTGRGTPPAPSASTASATIAPSPSASPVTVPTSASSPTARPTPAPVAAPAPVVPSAAPAPVVPSAAPPARPAGAGPDCGGPDSFEPPVQDGRPIFYTSTPAASGDGSNGRVPASAMAPLAWCEDSQGNKQWLRAEAATALSRMNEDFRAEFGENIAVDLSYRSYDQQVAMRASYGSLAAKPGTSNHGRGTAIDTWEWAAYGFGAPRYDWLVLHAPEYGWVSPAWARADGSTPEYWHFEYTG